MPKVFLSSILILNFELFKIIARNLYLINIIFYIFYIKMLLI